MKSFLLLLICLLLTSCGSNEASSPVSSEAPVGRSILALGDSLTAGYGLPVEQSYPAQLEARLAELGYSYRIQNAGVS